MENSIKEKVSMRVFNKFDKESVDKLEGVIELEEEGGAWISIVQNVEASFQNGQWELKLVFGPI